ncbi:hypothetical protein G9P44_003565 [Scheffersomyces stipitis]|nr:hypothetical protein G9P44_003565 [Scheffersomyces stipitis]
MSVSDIEAERTRYYDAYDADDAELDGFIVSDEENDNLENENRNERDPDSRNQDDVDEYGQPQIDRIRTMTEALAPNESQASKVLRAHISVLVSALGGPDHTSNISPPPYKLGHDALACLKDIKRWIKSVDDRQDSYQVALACAESGLVINDLIVILCQWDSKNKKKEDFRNKRTMEKIMLACLELLVLLTWSVELRPESSDKQKLLYYDVKKAQIKYKRAILTYNKGQTLKAVIRLVLPIISKERVDREPKDNAIMRLVLFFFRNILYVEPPSPSISKKSSKTIVVTDNMPEGVSYDDISLSATISAFSKNRVLMLFLTLSSGIGVDFDSRFLGPTLLECIHLLVRGVDPNDILKLKQMRIPTEINDPGNSSSPFHNVPPASSTTGLQLQDLLAKESKIKNSQTQSMSTRHGRFGSLLSIRGDHSMSFVVSGQEALINAGQTMQKLDRSKKWKNRSYFKYDSDEYTKSSNTTYMNHGGLVILHEFIESFLAGGCFNILIEKLSSVFSSSDSILEKEYETATFFLTIAWFFQYKREKTVLYTSGTTNLQPIGEEDDRNDFGSVGAALSQVNFILLVKYCVDSFSISPKRWSSLHVVLICLKELLEISNTLFTRSSSSAGDEEQNELDRELAEGIISHLLVTQDFLSILYHLPQTASRHSPEYLKVCISVVHILLKTLKNFAEEDVKLFIQTTRRNSKKKANKESNDQTDAVEQVDESDTEDKRTHARVTRERKINYERTEVKFFHQDTVSTYIEYLSRYEDLTHYEIKKCLTYFHRLFVVRKDFNGLYRLDFMQVLHKLRDYLPSQSNIRGQVDEFIYYFMKKFKASIERFPNPIEILFPRFEDAESKTYLATGELYIQTEREIRSANVKSLEPGKPLEFVRHFEDNEKYKILVSALYEQGLSNMLVCLVEDLQRIHGIKQLDEDVDEVLQLKEDFRQYVLTNSHLRLLLRTVGLIPGYSLNQECQVPSKLTSSDIDSAITLIKKWMGLQPATFEDGKDPSYFLRSTGDTVDRPIDYSDSEDDIAFEITPKDRPNESHYDMLTELDELERAISGAENREKGKARKRGNKSSSTIKKKSLQSRSRRPPRFNVDSDDESELRKEVKSSEFVHDSDDESDDEAFFEREERLRQMLNSSGGIVNAQQLSEFKKVWASLESTGGIATASQVVRAVESVANISDGVDTHSHQDDSQLGRTGLTVTQPESQISESQPSDSENEDSSEEVSEVQIRKRLRIEDDENDSDNNVSENYVSAEEGEEATPTVKRKKRLVISDDEDE